MVSSSEMQYAAMLQGEKRSLEYAIDIFTNGEGRITRMTVSTGDGFEPGGFVDVDVSFVAFPPEVIDAIVTDMQARVDSINSTLNTLGVSDDSPPMRVAKSA